MKRSERGCGRDDDEGDEFVLTNVVSGSVGRPARVFSGSQGFGGKGVSECWFEKQRRLQLIGRPEELWSSLCLARL